MSFDEFAARPPGTELPSAGLMRRLTAFAAGPAAEAILTVVAGVIRQAITDDGAAGLLVLEPESPEGRLVLDWAAVAIGPEAVFHLPPPEAPPGGPPRGITAVRMREQRRAEARVLAVEKRLLLAHPANRTALLLGMDLPPESLLPLGDLYASDMQLLVGGHSVPDDVSSMAEAAGGIERLDGALAAWLEDRHDLDDALSRLPPDARDAVRTRLLRNRAARRWPRRVPKLGSRTLWIDLFA